MFKKRLIFNSHSPTTKLSTVVVAVLCCFQIEAISWDVPLQVNEPTWMQFAGVFKDDSDFKEIMDAIRAERTSNDDSEVDPSYYL